jgi:hypothetical protein
LSPRGSPQHIAVEVPNVPYSADLEASLILVMKRS